MSIELTNDEKIMIVEQHLKNLAYTEYNITISLEEARAVAVPDQTTIDTLTLQLDDTRSKSLVLEAELSNLQTA